ncbi:MULTISPECIES: M20/M25/M40 family metallo-hydrolase [unclassified Caulobacter]|uniref:M20/M25/M40 family metallo-hydrolase n=1 Tax=unclassified Caulobacter TaxID=2648921 RepID=UPI0006F6B924|nr:MULTISPECIES: M20/M25/M40 family metallo-hydrolase [unclassified Caulobacter]KQV56060.1 aminopeptidase [Caulobacter sp. Root342]KQV70765.1 aminopeptidase [Caulobacter sp. Root343]
MSFTRRAALASAALLMVAQPVLAAAPAKPAASSMKKAAASDFVPSPEAIKAHMTFLADDAMEGREAGTRGYDIAANYVAAQYALLGVKPAGDKTAAGTSYQQHVPLLAYRPNGEGSVAITGPDGKEAALKYGEDYLPGPQAQAADLTVSAPLVFVGYGLVDAGRGRDDYAGLDVKGKIVVMLSGAPTSIQTEERAHFSNPNVKRLEAAKRGAVGVMIMPTTSSEKRRPFARGLMGMKEWRVIWRNAQDVGAIRAPSAPSLVTLSLAGAEKLFAGAPTPLATVLTEAETPAGAVKGFALATKANVVLKTEIEKRESSNVVGMIEGADPTLKAQTVILSAHLDHIGIKDNAKPGEDRINNGALDNASGIATLLEVARGFKNTKVRPKRSIILLAVTGEEKGLIGSDYFANNPTVTKADIAADVNLDMPVLLYPFTDVIAFGADRSTVGEAVKHAAGRVGVALSGDPLPEEGLFTRSDHYRFVEQGIPSVFLMTGFQNGGEKAFTTFLKTNYHHPGDDLNQPIDYQAAAKFALVNYEIARELADTPARPVWKKGDFFGAAFAPAGHPSAAK